MARKPDRKPGYTPKVAGRRRDGASPEGPSRLAPLAPQGPEEDAALAPQGTEDDAPLAPQGPEDDAALAPQGPDDDAATSPRMGEPTGKPRNRPVSRVSTLRPGGSDEVTQGVTLKKGARTRKGAATKESANKGPRSARGGWFSTRTVGILVAVAAALAVVAGVFALHPGASIGDNKAFIDQPATTELIAQAGDKICLANSADGTRFDEWSAEAKGALTGEALEQFEQTLVATRQVVVDAKAVTECQIDAIGVQNLATADDGSPTATVLANMIVSGSANGVPTESLAPRYQVSMVQRDGSWLISELEPVGGQ